MPTLFAFLDPSPTTMLILGALAVLLFGERLPEVARTFGKTFMQLKNGLRDVQNEIQNVVNSATSMDSSRDASSVSPYAEYPQPAELEEATAPKFEPPPSV